MTYMQRRSKSKQIAANLVVYSISVFLGTVALVFFYNLWNSTVGHLIIFMSPYLIYIAGSYGLSHRKRKFTTEKKEKLATDFPGQKAPRTLHR
ncbi:MAG: hypothetical protein HOI47_12850 [Candidatus Scalindua sp.]|jgi:hypothetical protein|nr:hypothetical protein [Candidatus Scalindua sp.]MBT6227530.1 hypothetical protein [Candidatus Scalindua sp.]